MEFTCHIYFSRRLVHPLTSSLFAPSFDASVFVSQTTDFLRVTFRFFFAIASVVSFNAVIVLGYRLGILFSLSKIVPAMRSTEGEFDTETLLDVNSRVCRIYRCPHSNWYHALSSLSPY